MRVTAVLLSAVCVTGSQLIPATSHAQFYDPAMVNAQANIFLNAEINRVTINTGAQGRASASTHRPTQPPIESRVEVAALEALRAGLVKRWQAQGETAAKRWYVKAARTIGQEMGSLASEHRRRVERHGQAAADHWYLAQARAAGARLSSM